MRQRGASERFAKDGMNYTLRGTGRECVLFLSGCGPGQAIWGRAGYLVRKLGETNRILIPDWGGQGKSESTEPAKDIDSVVVSLISLLDEIGIKKATLIGYSWGGLIAQRIAATYPSYVIRLVLLSTYVEQRSIKFWVIYNLILLGLILGCRPLSTRLMYGISIRYDEDKRVGHGNRRFSQEMAAASWKHMYALVKNVIRPFNSRSWLGRVTCPTQIIVGENDPLCDTVQLYGIQRGLQSLRDQLRIDYVASGHVPLDDNIRGVTSLVQDFILKT